MPINDRGAWRRGRRACSSPRTSAGTRSRRPPLEDGQVLVQSVYLSLDPTNRGWAAGDTYMPAVALGEVMRGLAVGRVLESRASGFASGDLVSGLLGWQRYAVLPARALAKLPDVGLPLEAHLGLLGHIGLTAWVGLIEIGRAQSGETLVVSGAAGRGRLAGRPDRQDPRLARGRHRRQRGEVPLPHRGARLRRRDQLRKNDRARRAAPGLPGRVSTSTSTTWAARRSRPRSPSCATTAAW